MSKNSGNNDDDEKYGPRVEVKLDIEGANLILQRHLSKSCTSIREVKRGYNNRIYIVNTSASAAEDNDTTAGANNNSTYVIRLPGIHWKKLKTEGEVAGIIYLKIKCPDIPLPKIYGYCSNKELSNIGYEYILMEYIEGEPLDNVLSNMTFELQKQIIVQVSKYVAAIKSIKFNTIGSFNFLPKISNTYGLDLTIFNNIQIDDIIIGQILDQGEGPFTNWLDYFKAICYIEINELKKCKFMEPQMKNLTRIENFLVVMTNPTSTKLSYNFVNPDFVFMHGDFESRNILVNGTTLTGILDLEFSGSFPIDNEWFDGFSDFGANTSEWFIFNEEPHKDQPNPQLIKPIRDYFLSECQKLHTPIPSEILGHFERAELYYFSCNICPWYLREAREDTPEYWFSERDLSLKRVEYILSKYGF